jgi:glucosamine kinase
MNVKLGVDGGGTKTECIAVDDTGTIVGRHLAAGCNPNVAGPEAARRIVTEALAALRAGLRGPAGGAAEIRSTHLFMSGAPGFWQEFAAELSGCGKVTAEIDSLPILELATGGGPGLVLHAGTGSFVAARAPDGSIHYAGGTGWRFGDPGSGYELGRRAIGQALLELQGWLPPSGLGPLVRQHAEVGPAADVRAITRYFYQHAEPNRVIAALAPAVLGLAENGDPAARTVVAASASELVELARRVADKLFPGVPLGQVPAGLSGALLTHPLVFATLQGQATFRFGRVTESPIEGVRRLVARAT